MNFFEKAKKFFASKAKKPGGKEKLGKEKYGWRDELRDWALSFAIAAAVYFLILPAVLGTTTPAVVVASCSEKGFLNIGDVLVLQGVKASDVKAPLVTVDRFTGFRTIVRDNEVVGLNVSGQVVMLDRSSDIVVYYANPSRIQVIHRVFARVNETSKNRVLLITKGDANSIPDQLSRNGIACVDENFGCISTPVTQEMLVGKQAFFALPFLGHVKLFFCDASFNTVCDGHANLGTGYKYELSC